jgi:large subunit ribosomal protein L23
MLIKRPHITEKSLRLAEEQNKFTFEVSLSANTRSASMELKDMFGVTVLEAKTHTRLGKERRFGKQRKPGRTANRKFMIFKLKEGDKIELFTAK